MRIRRVLASGDGKHAPVDSPRFRFYVRSKGFAVIDLPVLGLKEVLCVPAPKGSETKTSLLGNWLKVANVSEIYDILITIHEGSRVHAGYRKVFADIIRKVVRLWPGDCKIVTGRPRHPQSQGLVEQAHRTVQHMLAVRRAESPGTGWTKYLSLVQYAMNTQIHSAINVAPYDVVFGQPPTDGVFPGCHKDVQPEEEDLLKVLKDIPTLTDEYGNDSPDEGDGHVEDHTVSTSERACQFVNSTISSLPDNHNDKDNDGIETLLEDIPTLDKHDGNDSSDKGDEDDVEMARVCRADITCQFGNATIASPPDNDNDNDDIETVGDDGIDFSEKRFVEMDEVSTCTKTDRTYQLGNGNDYIETSEGSTGGLLATSRQHIQRRKRALDNYIKSAEKQMYKHSKSKRVKLQPYAVGDYVTVRIPQQDRMSTDLPRLLAVVVEIRGTKRISYRLRSKYGVLERLYDDNNLEVFLGKIEDLSTSNWENDRKISLREAVRLARQKRGGLIACKTVQM
ncbi:uncharacterized protein LOC134186244 isoform X3 [Corticium candelabrum]|uniref:uncharacterized protein LOC134186244 isoform X3 n=1 Tax=Corticium candelabrum TaxID=121492 RepID=UPI002E25491A|nr:uncharacterized protein LOC134186244 isoform X3 [Corticium candelabrum]